MFYFLRSNYGCCISVFLLDLWSSYHPANISVSMQFNTPTQVTITQCPSLNPIATSCDKQKKILFSIIKSNPLLIELLILARVFSFPANILEIANPWYRRDLFD